MTEHLPAVLTLILSLAALIQIDEQTSNSGTLLAQSYETHEYYKGGLPQKTTPSPYSIADHMFPSGNVQQSGTNSTIKDDD